MCPQSSLLGGCKFWRRVGFYQLKRPPKLNKRHQPRYLKKVRRYKIEHADYGPPCVERWAFHVRCEGQRYSREHHGQHDQRELDDAHDEVDFHQLACKRTESQAADKARCYAAVLKQDQQWRDREDPAHQSPQSEDPQREADYQSAVGDEIGLVSGERIVRRPLNRCEPEGKAAAKERDAQQLQKDKRKRAAGKREIVAAQDSVASDAGEDGPREDGDRNEPKRGANDGRRDDGVNTGGDLGGAHRVDNRELVNAGDRELARHGGVDLQAFV